VVKTVFASLVAALPRWDLRGKFVFSFLVAALSGWDLRGEAATPLGDDAGR